MDIDSKIADLAEKISLNNKNANSNRYDMCIYVYELDSLILQKHNNNHQSNSYVNERKRMMEKLGIKKTQFCVYKAVGEKLEAYARRTPTDPDKTIDKDSFSVKGFYKEHCSTPKPVKPKQPSKHEKLVKLVIGIKELAGNDSWSRILTKLNITEEEFDNLVK